MIDATMFATINAMVTCVLILTPYLHTPILLIAVRGQWPECTILTSALQVRVVSV